MKTIAGALRQTIIDANIVGNRVYLDFAPVDIERVPYITYNDNAGYAPAQRGDAKTQFYNRSIQLNLWQKSNDEDPALAHRFVQTLDGATLHVEGSAMAIRVKVDSWNRLADNFEDQLIHNEVSVSLVNPRDLI